MATRQEIDSRLAAGPQTQDALDLILLEYSPEQLAAFFPEYGDASNYQNASREAAMRSGATDDQLDFIDWQMQQPNPYGTGTLGDVYTAQGIKNPYGSDLLTSRAQEELDRAARREDMFSQAGVPAPAEDIRPWMIPAVGSGGASAPGSASTGMVPPASQVAGGTLDPNNLKSNLLRANSNLRVGGSMTPQAFTQTQMGSEFGAMQTPQATYNSDLIKSLRSADAPTVSNAGFTQYSMSAPQGGSNYLTPGSSNPNSAFNPQALAPDVASADDVANWNKYSTYRTNALTAKTPYVTFDEWLAGGKVSGIPEPVVNTPETVYNYGANDGGGA